MSQKKAMTDAALMARAQGCWLGQLTGDALGSIVEFQGAEGIARQYPAGLQEIGPSPVWDTLAGQPTDDSELALALARTLVTTGQYDAEAVAGAYVDWYESDPFDIGNATRTALYAGADARQKGKPLGPAMNHAALKDSEANGALMRQSPLAIWGHALPAEILTDALQQDSAFTHPNKVCQDASAAMIVPIAAIIREGLDAEGAYAFAVAWGEAHGASPTVTRVLHAARVELPKYAPQQGHVLIALQNAWYQALHAPSFSEGVIATVAGGGDTDTNGAIAGALLGALHGIDGVPVQWCDAVYSCRPEMGKPDVYRPRPPIYWPTDALDLAAALLTAT